MQYLLASLYNPTKYTLLQAIKSVNFIGWTGFTSDNANKLLNETPATAKGHLDQHRNNLQSTKNETEMQDVSLTESATITNQVISVLFENRAIKRDILILLTPSHTPARPETIVISLYCTTMTVTQF